MDTYGAGGIGAASVIIIGGLYKLLHHFQCKSRCCGSGESSIKINLDSPPTPEAALSQEDYLKYQQENA